MSGFRIRVCGSGNRLDSFLLFGSRGIAAAHSAQIIKKQSACALDEHRGLLFTRKYVMKRFVLT